MASWVDHAAVARNELIRRMLRGGLRVAAPWVRRSLRRRIATFPRAQAGLRSRYGVTDATPILPWGPETEAALQAWADRHPAARMAETSGSTGRPKRVPYTTARLRRIKRGSWEAAVQAGSVHGVRRPTLFVLAGLARDRSLSTLMLDEGRWTPFLQGLVMPSKLLWDPDAAPLVERFGPTACRLWLLLLADPGFLYGTNPSTLAVFCEALEQDWDGAVALARAFRDDRAGLGPVATRLLRRAAAPGWEARLARAADADAAPPLGDLLPSLRCYACWDGGYVGPFLERVQRALPAPRFAHVPMYSMSTETVQTQTVYVDGVARFLPLAPGVLYEFLPADAPTDDPAALLAATALEEGAEVLMVVSDAHGLRRYMTEDVFRVAGAVGGLPDLRFERRRGLAYSFTGEKLTGEQVEAAGRVLRGRFETLERRGVLLALVPSLEADLPAYRLLLAWPGVPGSHLDLAAVGAALDEALAAGNREYAAKRASDRLGPVRAVAAPYDAVARRLAGGAGDARGWDTQFKLLPLYAQTWQTLGLDGLASAEEAATR